MTRFLLLMVLAFASVSSYSPMALADEQTDETFRLQVLGINDFHGQVTLLNGNGGMQRLTNHLLQAIEQTDEFTFVLHGGDHVGASPAESALLQDEPAIDFLNTLQSYCRVEKKGRCQVLGTAGNHEFDEGSEEMLRLLEGGNHEKGPFIHPQWPGANYQTLSANVVDKASNTLLLEPYAVYDVNNVKVGIIGITLDSTPELVVPGTVDNLKFSNQADAVQYYASKLQSEGVETLIVVVHDGYDGEHYDGITQNNQVIPADSHFGKFVHQLPVSVDLVVTGHSHGFTNVYLPREDALPLLVTQAYSNGLAYADISLTIDSNSGDVTNSQAEIIRTDSPVELHGKAKRVSANINGLIAKSVDYAQSYTSQVINTYQAKAGELVLGEFIANAHLYVLDADIAVMNSGGVRADLDEGEVTWGELFSIQPFGNTLMVKAYSGEQLIALLEKGHHWSAGVTKSAQGFWLIFGQRVQPTNTYRVGGNNYVMNSAGFKDGKLLYTGGSDIDATVAFMQRLPTPFNLSDRPNQPAEK